MESIGRPDSACDLRHWNYSAEQSNLSNGIFLIFDIHSSTDDNVTLSRS